MLFHIIFFRLLFALGIRGVGIQNAKDISKVYSGNFLKFWQDVKAAAGTQLLAYNRI